MSIPSLSNIIYDGTSAFAVGNESSWLLNVSELFDGSTFRYFVGDIATGWQVNRYDIISGLRTIATGTVSRPTTLIALQSLSYT